MAFIIALKQIVTEHNTIWQDLNSWHPRVPRVTPTVIKLMDWCQQKPHNPLHLITSLSSKLFHTYLGGPCTQSDGCHFHVCICPIFRNIPPIHKYTSWIWNICCWLMLLTLQIDCHKSWGHAIFLHKPKIPDRSKILQTFIPLQSAVFNRLKEHIPQHLKSWQHEWTVEQKHNSTHHWFWQQNTHTHTDFTLFKSGVHNILQYLRHSDKKKIYLQVSLSTILITLLPYHQKKKNDFKYQLTFCIVVTKFLTLHMRKPYTKLT